MTAPTPHRHTPGRPSPDGPASPRGGTPDPGRPTLRRILTGGRLLAPAGSGDPRLEQMRSATLAALLLGGFNVILAMSAWALTPADRPGFLLRALAGIVFAALLPAVPWWRLGPWALPVTVTAALAVAGVLAEGSRSYLALVSVAFVWLGLTQPPWASTLVIPVVVVAFAAGADLPLGEALTQLAVVAPSWVLVAVLLSQVSRSGERTSRLMSGLFHAASSLSRARTPAELAATAARAAATLADADVAAAVVTDGDGTRVRGTFARVGEAGPAERFAEIVARTDPGQLSATGGILSVPLASHPAGGVPGLGDLVASAVLVAVEGPAGPLGVLAVGWRDRRRGLRSVEEPLRLLATEVGVVLGRLVDTTRLETEAVTDPLTGLGNRRRLAAALDRLEPGDAVAVIDVDRFKRVNDTLGHAAGDRVLEQLARTMRAVARDDDVVCRPGGEEFVLILPGAGIEGARRVIEGVRERWNATGPVTTFSAGIAVNRPGEDPDDTVKRADAALYTAKRAGRDRVVVDPSDEAAVGPPHRV